MVRATANIAPRVRQALLGKAVTTLCSFLIQSCC
jgi:hypothetical protein